MLHGHKKAGGLQSPALSPNRSTDACRLGDSVIPQGLRGWRERCYGLMAWWAFAHWRRTGHLSQNEGGAVLVMRSSYEVRLEQPGGVRTVVVRASSRSDACQMAAAAYPHCRFVVIGRLADPSGADPRVPVVASNRGGCR